MPKMTQSRESLRTEDLLQNAQRLRVLRRRRFRAAPDLGSDPHQNAAAPATARGLPPGTGRGRTPASPARELVSRYCVTCHNEKLKTANLLLDKADADQVFNSAETWEKVIVQLRSRSMPPPGSRRPDSATYDAVAAWLETELDRAAAAHPNPGRPADLHRLNRTEYSNAVRDLLAVEINGTAMLPPDEQAHGFDTNADALTVVPALLDRYLASAAKISRLAVGDPTVRPAFERYTAIANNSNERTWLWQTERLGEEFPLGSRGGIAARHYFPLDGEYIFRVRLDRTYTGLIRGLHVPNEIEIRVDGQRVGQFKLGGQPELRAPASLDANASNPLFTADERAGSARAGESWPPPGDGHRRQIRRGRNPKVWTRPYSDLGARIRRRHPCPDWSSRSCSSAARITASVPQDSPSRRRIFVCHWPRARHAVPPSLGEGDGSETACATKILSTLARRAYRGRRRPTTSRRCSGSSRAAAPTEISTQASGSALERLLVSPDFLFRIEADPAKCAPGAPYRLSDIELASRLSFFLWSSIPDDELLDLAIRGKLRDSGVLDRQVRRMLADPRARRRSWGTSSVSGCRFAMSGCSRRTRTGRFPWFDDNLRTAFVKRNRAVPRQPIAGGPQRRRSPDGGLHVPQRAAGASLWDFGCVRQPLPARGARRHEPLGAARQGEHPGDDVLPPSHVADDSRQMAAREHSGCSRAASAAEREHDSRRGEDGEGRVRARDAGAAPREPSVRELSRAHGSAGLQPREFRCAWANGARRTEQPRSTRPACSSTARR